MPAVRGHDHDAQVPAHLQPPGVGPAKVGEDDDGALGHLREQALVVHPPMHHELQALDAAQAAAELGAGRALVQEDGESGADPSEPLGQIPVPGQLPHGAGPQVLEEHGDPERGPAALADLLLQSSRSLRRDDAGVGDDLRPAAESPVDLLGRRAGEGDDGLGCLDQHGQALGVLPLLLSGAQMRMGQIVHGEHQTDPGGAALLDERAHLLRGAVLEAEVHVQDIHAIGVLGQALRFEQRVRDPGPRSCCVELGGCDELESVPAGQRLHGVHIGVMGGDRRCSQPLTPLHSTMHRCQPSTAFRAEGTPRGPLS